MAQKVTKKLTRSRSDRMITGLCGGIANYFNWDATMVRLVAIVLEFATAGLLFVGYLVISLFVPLELEKGAKNG